MARINRGAVNHITAGRLAKTYSRLDQSFMEPKAMSKENVETVVLEEDYLRKIVKRPPDAPEEATEDPDKEADED